MGNKVRLKLDPTQKILLKRGLNKNGAAQRFFSNELRRKMDPYVPMRSGVLKNTAVVHESSVEYVTPYARRQYYENKGTGMRGKQWAKRCWAENGDQIVESVAKFAGGEVK